MVSKANYEIYLVFFLYVLLDSVDSPLAMSRNSRSRDKGVSLVEASLVTLFIVSPETPLPDGRILTDVGPPGPLFFYSEGLTRQIKRTGVRLS